MSEDIKEILNHLVISPTEHQIQIDFDLSKRIFILSIPIYKSRAFLSEGIKKYVEARQGRTFKPHSTSFHVETQNRVLLIQEIPFRWGFSPGTRKEIQDFLILAKRCHRMLYEIAFEETCKLASDAIA